jgi:hypothetical protein
MASRYWRVVGLESYSAADLELSALHLYDASGRVDASAVLTCSHTPISGSLASLQDSDASSLCKFSAAQVSSPGFFLQWDLGAGVAKDVIGVRVGSTAAIDGFLAVCTLQSLSAQWDTLGTLGRIQFPGASTLAPLIAIGDSDYPSVVLLARADGADGATTFVDKSSYGRVITARGGAKTSTTVTLFGQPMMYFDGVDDYAECASGADFSLPGDLTLEIWAHPASSDSTQRWLFGNYSASAYGGIGLWRQNGYIGLVKAGVTGLIAPGTQQAPTGQLSYIKVIKTGTSIAMSVNGVSAGSISGFDFVPSGTPRVGIGALCNDATGTVPIAGTFFHGYLAVRLTKGVSRSGSVPTAAFPESASIGSFGAFPVRSRRMSASTMASAMVPVHSSVSAPGILLARDIEFGGAGRVWGTTKTKGTPNTPIKARVVLQHQRSKLPVRETWSDPVTGAFEFTGIDTNQQYLTLAEDAEGNFRPVAANRLTPEVLP